MSINYSTDEVFDQDAPEFLRVIIDVPRRHAVMIENCAAEFRLITVVDKHWFTASIEMVGAAWNLQAFSNFLTANNYAVLTARV